MLFAALTACWLPTLLLLRLETDGRDLFSPRHPAIRFQESVDRDFATSDFLVVGIEATGSADVFEPAVLNAVLDLGEAISAIEGVSASEIRSLATEVSPQRETGVLRLAPPLATSVSTAAEAERVRREARAEPLFVGTLVSEDERATALYVPIDSGVDRQRVFEQVRLLANERFDRDERLAAYRIHLIGPAAAESLLGTHVLADLALLLPLSLAVVAAVLGLWFRHWGIVAIGLGEGSAVVLWTLGSMSLAGRPISLVTVVMPVILVTYCVADTIHIGQCLVTLRRQQPTADARRLVESAVGEVLRPVAFTSLTTAAGFLAFAFSPIPPLRTFGLFSALGVLLALALSLLVVPSGLLVTGFAHRPAAGGRSRVDRGLGGLTALAADRPWTVLAAAALTTVLLIAGAFRLQIQDSWIGNFRSTSPVVTSDAWFNQAFFGSNILNWVVTLPDASAYDPRVLAELEALQRELEARPEVGGTRSLADPLRVVGRALEGAERPPRSRGEGEEWALLSRMAGGSRSLDPYVDVEGRSLNLWIFLNRGDYRRTATVLEVADRFQWNLPAEAAAPSPRPAGDAYLGHELVRSIAYSQVSSALVALLVTFLTVWWMLRSVSLSLLALLPVSLSVVWNLGLMGWLGLPLGIATSSFCAIAFGVGVDFALHWIARLELGRARGLGFYDALRFAGIRTGKAILSNGWVLTLGFAVLLLSAVPPTRRLALILCSNLTSCLAATLLLLPAAACLLERRKSRSAALFPATWRTGSAAR